MYPQQELDGTAVALFTQPGCGPCIAVKRALQSKGIEFTEVNAREDEAAQKFIATLRDAEGKPYQGTPILYVSTPEGDVHWHGFDPVKMQTHIFDNQWP